MPKAQLSNSLRIHYQQVGTGPDVVMIHGLTGNLAVWHLHIVPALAERFRILTYDLRGHGRSDVPPSGYSADDMAGDLAELLDALEIDRPVMIGHSYGADIALYFAARYPEHVLEVIAIEAALPALEDTRSDDSWVGWANWANALEQSGVHIPSERRTDLRYMVRATVDLPKQWGPLKGLPRSPKPLLRLLDDTTLPEDYRRVGTLTLERIEGLETPVVLMYAAQSAFIGTFEYLMAHLPNPQPVLLPSSEWGHFGPLEQPELVARELARRLSAAESIEIGSD